MKTSTLFKAYTYCRNEMAHAVNARPCGESGIAAEKDYQARQWQRRDRLALTLQARIERRLDMPTLLDELLASRIALKQSGIGGIYAEFDDLPDAIEQMTSHIKELTIECNGLQAVNDRLRRQIVGG